MLSVFDVGMTVHLTEKVSGAMGQVIKSLYAGHRAAGALEKKLKAVHNMFNSGMIMFAGGAALAAPLVHMEQAAEKLENSMKRLQISTRASNTEMADFNKQFSQVSNMTGIFSKPKLADFAYSMRESGLDKNQIKELLPLYAKGADVMHLLSEGKINADSSAHGFSSLAHQFGQYSAKAMTPIIEASMRMAPQLPGGLDTLVRAGSYVNIIGNRTMGIDPVKLMALEATVAQTSGGKGTGRGALSAANLANALQRTMPGVFGSGLLSGKSAYAAQVLGMADKNGIATTTHIDKKTGKKVADIDMIMGKFMAVQQQTETAAGRVDFAKLMMSKINYLPEKQQDQLVPMIQEIIKSKGMAGNQGQLMTTLLGFEGGSAKTIQTLFGDKQFAAQYKKNYELATTGKNIDETQADLSKTAVFQRIRAATNLETLMSTVGQAMLPTFKRIITGMGDLLYAMNNFAEAHPRIVKAAVGILSLASAALMIGGAVNMARAGFMGIQLVLGGLGFAAKIAFNPLIGSMARLVPLLLVSAPLITAGLVVGIGALILIIKNWDKINMLFKNNVDLIKVALAGMLEVGDKAAGILRRLGAQIAGFCSMIGSAVGSMFGQKPPGPGGGGAAPGKPWWENIWHVDKAAVDKANKKLEQHGMLKTVDDWSKTSQGGLTPVNAIPPKQASSAPAPNVVINQTNTNHIHAQPHHDVNQLADKVAKIHTRNNQFAAKTATQGNGVYNSKFKQGGGNE